MAKVLVLGAAGMAGHVIAFHLQAVGNEVIAAVRRRPPKDMSCPVVTFDAEQEGSLSDLIQITKPDQVVNCVGVLVKASEQNPERAILLNALFPHRLTSLGRRYGFRLLHLSTDCVFSGNKGGYSEMAFRDGDSVYGRTKALGEVVGANCMTIRTSIVGPEIRAEGTGLFHWFMNQEGHVNGYVNHLWGGVTTVELAKAVAFLVQERICGLVHLTNGTAISKYKMLSLFSALWRGGTVRVDPCDTPNALDRSLVSTREDFHYVVPSYEEMFQELLEYMRPDPIGYREIYGDF